MFSEGGNKAVTAVTAQASAQIAALPLRSFSHASLPEPLVSPMRAHRAIVPLLLAEAAAFALAAGSGKIPAFLFTAVRALLTF
ncbi:MAG: hypothetical protein NEA02_09035 [Thermoanaerobaculia bacterium]|nr:hypothetical protein [Thermoanaerobaculia bacterium]